MAKTQEELAQLKNEYESLNNKLKELTEEELKLVTGGYPNAYDPPNLMKPGQHTKLTMTINED